MSDKKFKDTGFALACWILVALILLVFFFVKKDTIVANLRHTNFINRVTGKAAEDDGMTESTGNLSKAGDEDEEDEDETKHTDNSATGEAAGGNEEIAITGKKEEAVGDGLPAPPPVLPYNTSKDERASTKEDTVKPMKKPVIEGGSEAKKDAAGSAQSKEMMSVKLCFVVVDSDGIVSRNITERKLPKTPSPLTASINALLAGPVEGGETLIPEGTRLLGAQVRGGVATLNFSEEFAFNPLGVEGYMAQLMQVVYTATAFNTVNSVQFIINGQHLDYLGSEGEWIGSPLSRASFR